MSYGGIFRGFGIGGRLTPLHSLSSQKLKVVVVVAGGAWKDPKLEGQKGMVIGEAELVEEREE